VAITWHRTKQKRATNNTRNEWAKPWRKRKGRLRRSDTSTKDTGGKREKTTLAGNIRRAEVTHHTPWSNPASQGERAKSWRIKGRKRPKEKEMAATLLC
jgi:hypothetical protein